MTSNPRYAIYYAPAPDSDLDRFGADLLGYDAFGGLDRAVSRRHRKSDSGLARPEPGSPEIRFPRHFESALPLAPGKTTTELLAACETFANAPRPVPVIKPIVNVISGFIAIVPADPSGELGRLAADCVGAFDGFRAPLTAEDRARRNPSQLTPSQRNHLDRWGYPYVMEDFRFHMTLTGRLGAERRETVLAILQRRFAALKITTLAIDGIALFRQDGADSRFRIAKYFLLSRT